MNKGFCIARRTPGLVAAALLASASLPGRAQPLPSYTVGTLPVAAGQADVEFPLAGDFRGQLGSLFLSQGTFDDRNPFAYLSQVAPWVWLHYDGVRNLRLSAGFQEAWSFSVPPLRIPSGHEERYSARARLQEPKGASALYQMVQLDLRSFDDPTGKHQVVFRPRFRFGVGLNLDATRIHSMALYQEGALRFGDSSYISRAFDFYRAVIGYTWTTRRGVFVTAAVLGQVSLSPAGNSLAFAYGPVLSFAYRIAPSVKGEETPPEPAEVELR
ncbi:MAG: hypothetical protein ACJ78W_14300 [Myxococcales bacterium]|nr:hypothetical protein [Myxococcales bacterium]